MPPLSLLSLVVTSSAFAAAWEPEAKGQRALDRAEKAQADGKLDKAAKHLDKVLRQDSAPGRLLLARSKVALAMGDGATAHSLLEQCTTSFPERWDCPAQRAQLLAHQDRLTEAGPLAQSAWTRGCALPEIQALVGWHVGESEGPGALAQWLGEQEAPFAARPCLESAVAVDRGDVARATVSLHSCRQADSPLGAAASDRFQVSGIPLREADAVQPAPQPADLAAYETALIDLDEGRSEAAAHVFDQLVVRYPMDPDLRLRAAEAARRLGFADQARRELRAAVGMDPAVIATAAAPAGVLHPIESDGAASLIAGAAVILVDHLIDAGELVAAREVLATARDRLGDTAALSPVLRHIARAAEQP